MAADSKCVSCVSEWAFALGFEVSDGNEARFELPRPAKSADRGYHPEVTPGIHPQYGSRVECLGVFNRACVRRGLRFSD